MLPHFLFAKLIICVYSIALSSSLGTVIPPTLLWNIESRRCLHRCTFNFTITKPHICSRLFFLKAVPALSILIGH